MMLSWLVYVPIYLVILRRRSRTLYERLGGRPFLGAHDLFTLMIFLWRREYLATDDPTVSRHSRILAVTLFGGLAVGIASPTLGYWLGP